MGIIIALVWLWLSAGDADKIEDILNRLFK